MPVKKPLAFSYIRMSTLEQLKGDSRRRQTELSEKFAAKHDLQMAPKDRYEDFGISAFKGANLQTGALGRFVAAAESGDIPKGSYLLVESLDRISRQELEEAFTLFLRIVTAGIVIVTLVDERVYKKGLQLHDFMFSLMDLSRAHQESKMKSSRLSASWKAKRARASTSRMTSVAPAWLKPTENGSFEIIDARVKIVREIFEASAAGQGAFTIARKLNERKIPKFTKKGKPGWQRSYVLKILTNRSVLGEAQPHMMVGGKRTPEGDAIPNYFPRIIDDELFYRVQGGRIDRKANGAGRKGVGRPNLFSGIVRCGYCSSPMDYVNKGSGCTYLICNRGRRGLGCHKGAWPYPEFERSFLTFSGEVNFSELFDKSQNFSKRQQLADQIDALTGQLGALKERQELTYALLGEKPSTFVKRKLDDIEAEIESLSSKLEAVRNEHSKLESEQKHFVSDGKSLGTFISELRGDVGGDVEDVRANVSGKIKTLVKEVYLLDGGITPETIKHLQASSNSKFHEELVKRLSVSIMFENRFFIAYFKSGAILTILPTLGHPGRVAATFRSAKNEQLFLGMKASTAPFGPPWVDPEVARLYPDLARAKGAILE